MSPLLEVQTRHALRLAYLGLLLLGLAALAAVTRQSQARLERFDCPAPHAQAQAALASFDLSSVTWELAGNGARAARQLRPVSDDQFSRAPGLDERLCAQARIQYLLDGYERLDQPLFMPLYGLLSVLMAGWVVLDHGSAKRLRPRLASALVALTTVLLLYADAIENHRALALLAEASRSLLSMAGAAALEPAAHALRQASLAKWGAACAWCAALAWSIWVWRPTHKRPWMQWPRLAAIGLLAMACGAFLAAVASGGSPDRFAGPVGLVQAGMACAVGAMAFVAVALWLARGEASRKDPDDEATAPKAPANPTPPVSPTIWRLSVTADPTKDFHMEEYRQLRAELITLLTRLEVLFRAAIVGVATAFAWLASSSLGLDGAETCLKLPRALVVFSWLIPPALVLCTGLLAKVTYLRVNEFGGYLRRLELALGHRALGWEAYLALQRAKLTPMAQGLWLLLLLLTVTATLVGLLTVDQARSGCLRASA